MPYTHTFTAHLSWPEAQTITPSSTRIYNKNHQVSIEGKAALSLSAAKAFKGDPSRLNPEDLLLSSLMSCHMMSYRYVCEQQGIEIISYTDRGQAFLETYPDGSGKISKVQLNPVVCISNPAQLDLALSLHAQAHKLCFIANSCAFPVQHQASCSAAAGNT